MSEERQIYTTADKDNEEVRKACEDSLNLAYDTICEENKSLMMKVKGYEKKVSEQNKRIVILQSENKELRESFDKLNICKCSNK